MKLNFREYGEGKLLILLYAFPLSGSMWSKQIDSLVSSGWRIILPDFPGFGENSIEIESEIIQMEDLAKAVSELLTDLGTSQAVIGGLSMGGYVALNFARMFPEKVLGLILADTSAAADSEEKRKSRF